MTHDYASAKYAAQVLRSHGFAAYIIGGAVRDLLLDKHPKDFDLVTNATPKQLKQLNEFQQTKYDDPAQAFGVTRVRFKHRGKEGEIEIATFRRDIEAHLGRKQTKVEFATLEDDVQRRDFTINALALDPVTNQIVDEVEGVKDLQARVVRFIGKPIDRIKEDPLRIMRAVRFKNHLGFRYGKRTERAIRDAAQKGYVNKIATDRLRNELTSLLLHPTRHQSIQDLYDLGILDIVLPEVTAGKGVQQPNQFHQEGDVWQHELLILDYLPEHPSRRLAWAALLHDIGKPATATPPKDMGDRIHFNRHYTVGANMARSLLKRLNFSNRDIKDITWMIHNHMSIDDLPDMRPSNQQKMLEHPAFADLLELHKADAAASWRPGEPHTKPQFQTIERIWQRHLNKSPEKQKPSLKRDLGIDGDWLLNNFGEKYQLKEGPELGRILDELREWYLDEGVKDVSAYKQKAESLIKERHV